jgi:ubiquinone/menaquinone biosynthesis C-methylase UbiE
MLNSSIREKIVQTISDYRASKILLVAAYYELFTLIDGGLRTLSGLTRKTKLNARALSLLLEACEALGYIKSHGTSWMIAPEYRPYLVKTSSAYMGDNLKYQEIIWDAWSDLRRVMKSGKPRRSLISWLSQKSFREEYIRGMANIAQRPADSIAEIFPPDSLSSMLDVGAGPGAYSLAFLRRHPKMIAHLLDLPATLRVSRKLTRGDPVFRRLSFIQGDYHKMPFGRKKFDVILMSHITHDEGPVENYRLFKKAFMALQPRGCLIVHDFMAEKAASVFCSLFSVHMLVYTQKGRVYSIDEYKSWLKNAGFRNISTTPIGQGSLNASTALVATRTLLR